MIKFKSFIICISEISNIRFEFTVYNIERYIENNVFGMLSFEKYLLITTVVYIFYCVG